ncbi:MAG: TRAP transporter permease [Spirochaetales bacterium]|uniref:TRAP transporter permease n=1 Tax=Candidatus Thalassospirochaeta sargassi TaxID=3119039 RepID=A0AAJ1IDC1_9SPIO|nr:TRAP transporter permease [Spirochaetales bacterium]
MTEENKKHSQLNNAEKLLKEETGQIRNTRKFDKFLIPFIAVAWSVFQLALPRFLILDSVTIRAIHLAFAVALVFVSIPMSKKDRRFKAMSTEDYIPVIDIILAVVAVLAVLYIVFDWENIASRAGRPTTRDIIIGIVIIILVLEASRRSIGLPLGIIAVIFSIYAFLGPHMPGFLAFRGVSLTKYLSQIVLSTGGIYGIPLDVSANTVFLFVLLGALLEKTGAGYFFNDLAISLLGRFKGGPAKASVVSSGLTGLVSGSSIANVVTTGTFTIPLMKKVGYPGKTAAATEVAASTNGQLMPPIMGAAAFIMAEYLGIGYMDVIKAAAIPAFVSYFALFYITHLEASKLGMEGLPKEEVPNFFDVFKKGFHNLIPLVVLIYELMVMRHSPKLSAFNAIVILFAVMLIRKIVDLSREKKSLGESIKEGVKYSVTTFGSGMISGSRNMLTVALATATAGIVVGIVNMGIGSMIVQVVEFLSMGNIYLLLIITGIASLIIGMGLPTTATYIVMASITVPIILELGGNIGLVIPAIAAHLFCFYFGILADDTPPVGLAAYTAAAIADSDPIPTGIQGFIYDLRTAVIPFMFIFNPQLIMDGVNNGFQGLFIFAMAVFGAFAFTNAVQGWFITKNKWWEVPFFLLAAVMFFNPFALGEIIGLVGNQSYWLYPVAGIVYLIPYLLQRLRMPKAAAI